MFKKVLYLERTVFKIYNPSHKKLIAKYVLDFIHDQNIQKNLSIIKNEAKMFGVLFIGDGATISKTALLKMLFSG